MEFAPVILPLVCAHMCVRVCVFLPPVQDTLINLMAIKSEVGLGLLNRMERLSAAVALMELGPSMIYRRSAYNDILNSASVPACRMYIYNAIIHSIIRSKALNFTVGRQQQS